MAVIIPLTPWLPPYLLVITTLSPVSRSVEKFLVALGLNSGDLSCAEFLRVGLLLNEALLQCTLGVCLC